MLVEDALDLELEPAPHLWRLHMAVTYGGYMAVTRRLRSISSWSPPHTSSTMSWMATRMGHGIRRSGVIECLIFSTYLRGGTGRGDRMGMGMGSSA